MNKFFSSKFFVMLLILILIGVLTALGKEGYRKYQLDKEINNLKQEIGNIKEENKKMSELLKYFESSEFLEKQARLKLNLLKEGEKLVIISQDNVEEKASNANSHTSLENKTNKKISNIKKWLKWLSF